MQYFSLCTRNRDCAKYFAFSAAIGFSFWLIFTTNFASISRISEPSFRNTGWTVVWKSEKWWNMKAENDGKDVRTNKDGKPCFKNVTSLSLHLFGWFLKTRALACCSLKIGYLETCYKADILASLLPCKCTPVLKYSTTSVYACYFTIWKNVGTVILNLWWYFFKCFKENGPGYVANLFKSRVTPYNLRSNGLNVVQTSYNSRFLHGSYAYMISHIWNQLPSAVKNAPNASSFRRLLTKLNFNGCQCSNCLWPDLFLFIYI